MLLEKRPSTSPTAIRFPTRTIKTIGSSSIRGAATPMRSERNRSQNIASFAKSCYTTGSWPVERKGRYTGFYRWLNVKQGQQVTEVGVPPLPEHNPMREARLFCAGFSFPGERGPPTDCCSLIGQCSRSPGSHCPRTRIGGGSAAKLVSSPAIVFLLAQPAGVCRQHRLPPWYWPTFG